jgi:hypothetical protein
MAETKFSTYGLSPLKITPFLPNHTPHMIANTFALSLLDRKAKLPPCAFLLWKDSQKLSTPWISI